MGTDSDPVEIRRTKQLSVRLPENLCWAIKMDALLLRSTLGEWLEQASQVKLLKQAGLTPQMSGDDEKSIDILVTSEL